MNKNMQSALSEVPRDFKSLLKAFAVLPFLCLSIYLGAKFFPRGPEVEGALLFYSPDFAVLLQFLILHLGLISLMAAFAKDNFARGWFFALRSSWVFLIFIFPAFSTIAFLIWIYLYAIFLRGIHVPANNRIFLCFIIIALPILFKFIFPFWPLYYFHSFPFVYL